MLSDSVLHGQAIARGDVNAFRTAVWPGGVVAVPEGFAWPGLALRGDGRLVVPGRGQIPTSPELPDELYLRELRDLNLSDSEAVVEFSRTYGLLRSHHEERSVDGLESALLSHLDPARAAVAELVHDGVTIREVVLLAQLLRDGARVWAAVQDEHRWGDLRAGWESELVSRPDSLDAAADFLASLLNWGLSSFHVSVSIERASDDDREGDTPYFSGSIPADLLASLCLQLANHISEGATYKECKNETCGRWFYRQRGRAEYGQFRTRGNLYCSTSCARTQSSRDSRRKAKERAAESPDSGPSR